MKKALSLFLVVCIILATVGCSQKKSNASAPSPAPSPPMVGGMAPEMAAPSAPPQFDASTGKGKVELGSVSVSVPKDERKIVYSAFLSLETLNFDETLASLTTLIDSNKGYIASTNSDGNAIGQTGRRSARLEVKVPVENYAAFLSGVDKSGTVFSKSESADDITAQYMDTDARLKTLMEQEKRLLQILEKAEKLEDLLAIETSLSEVRYQIESFTSQMNVYKNMVSYSTVTLEVREVKNISESDETFAQRIMVAIKGSIREAINTVENLFIALIYLVPYILVAVVLIVISIPIFKKRKDKKISKKTDEEPKK